MRSHLYQNISRGLVVYPKVMKRSAAESHSWRLRNILCEAVRLAGPQELQCDDPRPVWQPPEVIETPDPMI
jgi:hypothetical protein